MTTHGHIPILTTRKGGLALCAPLLLSRLWACLSARPLRGEPAPRSPHRPSG